MVKKHNQHGLQASSDLKGFFFLDPWQQVTYSPPLDGPGMVVVSSAKTLLYWEYCTLSSETLGVIEDVIQLYTQNLIPEIDDRLKKYSSQKY